MVTHFNAGIYLHWPFCERKCPYCDFYTFGREHPNIRHEEAYLEALLAEIRGAPERMGWSGKPRADSIYFGGGTPSLMGPAALGRILESLGDVFELGMDSGRPTSPTAALGGLDEHNAQEEIGQRLRQRQREQESRPGAAVPQSESCEITLEVNPTTAEAAQLDTMLALGVNRLSVGSQSFNDRILKELGRVHDAATTRRAIAHMRDVGATNLSLDIIFAAPTQTLDDLKCDLDAILAFAPEHVSAYGMTIHAGTPFERWQGAGRLALPGDDDYATMYETIVDTLAAAGYAHYEISNWARPGRESRHNAKYWRDCDVAAFGVSAHGVWGGRRFENPRDLKAYLAREGDAIAKPLDPPADERARRGETMMLALRRVGGVAWREIDAWAGGDTRAFYADELARLAERGLIENDGDRVRLTRAGLLLADGVMAEFF